MLLMNGVNILKTKKTLKMEFRVKKEVTLTKSQEFAAMELIDFIAAKFDVDDNIRALCGPGGTGKTFVTKYIIDNCKFSRSLIICAAPTHKACRVLSQSIGMDTYTIQSLLGLRPNLALEDFNPANPQFDPMGRNKLADPEKLVKLLIIDEASMLPAKMFSYITETCEQEQIKLICIGDASQLPPVNERYSIAFLNKKTYFLKEIVRQEATNPITKLLAILRQDIKNRQYSFLNYIIANPSSFNEIGEGYAVVGRQRFTEMVTEGFSDEEFTKNIDMYRLVAYTNIAVTSWNKFIRQIIIKDANRSILNKHDLIMSRKTIVDEFNTAILVNSEEYIINDIIDFIDPVYEFKGMMVRFQSIHGGKITPPIFIVNHFDPLTITKYYNIVNDLISRAKSANAGRASLWKEYYKFKRKYLICTNIVSPTDPNKIMMECDLDYGFAITSHRAQGSTYDNVYVDINDIVYDKTGMPYANADEMLRRLYVACSRARKKLIMCYGR